SSELDDESAEVGWVESESVITQSYITVDELEKLLFISGSGEAYQNPWGGKEDIVYELTAFENQEFEIGLTQKVGEDIWYQGVLDDKTVWIQSTHLKTEEPSNDSHENENAESDKQVGGDDTGAREPEESDEVKDDEQQNEENSKDEIEKDHQDDGKLEEDEADANHTTSEKALLKRSIASKVQESKTS